MEKLRLYDNFGNKTDIVVNRGEKFDEKLGNILLSVVLIKDKDKILLQKTSSLRNSEYAFTGGHVTFDETPLNTIVREVKEELGLDTKKEQYKLLKQIKNPNRPCILFVYLLEQKVNLNELKYQKEEVENVYMLTKEEIESLLENDNFRKSSKLINEEVKDII